MHIEWWYWIVLGILILLSEALTPGGFYQMFIGLAAIVTGAISHFIKPTWIEIALFAVLSIVFIVILRKPLVARVNKSTPTSDVPEFIGETGRALETIVAGAEGKIELRGSIWTAKNQSVKDIAQNGQCTITARSGLSMIVTPQ